MDFSTKWELKMSLADLPVYYHDSILSYMRFSDVNWKQNEMDQLDCEIAYHSIVPITYKDLQN